MKDKRENDNKNALVGFDNYFQNAIASMGVMGALGSAPTSEIELTQINSDGIETNNNLVEDKEEVEDKEKIKKKISR